MRADGPKTVLSVLATFNPNVKGKEKDVDLAKTDTTDFVKAAASK